MMHVTYDGSYEQTEDGLVFYGRLEDNTVHMHFVPYDAIYNRMELLGYDDPMVALDVLLVFEREHLEFTYTPIIQAYARGLSEEDMAPIKQQLRQALGAPEPTEGIAMNARRSQAAIDHAVPNRAMSLPIPELEKPAREQVPIGDLLMQMRDALQAARVVTVLDLNPYERLGTEKGEAP
jgi:hypothetical protein